MYGWLGRATSPPSIRSPQARRPHGLDRERARQRLGAAAGRVGDVDVPRRPLPAGEVEEPGEAAAVVGARARRSATTSAGRPLEAQRGARDEALAVDRGGDAARVAAAVGGHEDGVELVVLDRPDPAPVGDRAPSALRRLTWKVSSGSGSLSPLTGTPRLLLDIAGREGQRARRRLVVVRRSAVPFDGPVVDRDLECSAARES